jgi:hypothetical protein
MFKEGKLLDMIIISYGEKPGIQAKGDKYQDRMSVLGKYATVSRDHEYVIHGTISLFAGIDLLTGTVQYKIFDKHRSEEFIEFLKSVDSAYPKYGSSLYSMGNLRISICNLLMQHPALRPTCWAIDCDSIMNKWSSGNSVITSTRLQDSSLPTQNSEEP